MEHRHIIRRLFAIALATLSGVAWTTQVSATNLMTPQEINEDFHLLFDGDSLKGWHGYGGSDMTDRWLIKGGVLAINPASSERSDLVTDEKYQNFELRLDWNISVGGNSGIMFNVAEKPEFGKPWRTGPEVQILDNQKHKDSREGYRTGDLYDLVASEAAKGNPAGEWNESRLLIEDGLARHWLNGALTFEVQMWSPEWDELVAKSKFNSMPGFGSYRRGHIVLQDHGDVVRFRNIRIREF